MARARASSSILETAGIAPCNTAPSSLENVPGFLALINEGDSLVLNATGSRATLGYWVTPNNGTSFFVLMSYDHVRSPVDGSCLCAMEVFLFGPITQMDHGVPTPNPPPLLEGLAVKGDGTLLSEVPIEIAKVKNYLTSHPDTETVKPGVTTDGVGCRECHASNVHRDPQVTSPFPWFPVPIPPSSDADGGDANNEPEPDGGAAEAGPGTGK
jgi:hypothetical protein